MKYSKENALKEIKRRAKIIRQEKERRITNFVTATASITSVALFAVIGVFSEAEVSTKQTMYGSFILSAETGGYILTAVLGFALGVLVTIITRRMKNK